MRFSLSPDVVHDLSLPRWCLLCCTTFIFSLLLQVESAPQYDLHKYMTVGDLQFHFGVDSVDRVPDYDLSTPSYTAPYRSFPHHAQKRDWVHPARLHFDIEVFNTKYSIQATRNDVLVSPEFYYQVRQNSKCLIFIRSIHILSRCAYLHRPEILLLASGSPQLVWSYIFAYPATQCHT